MSEGPRIIASSDDFRLVRLANATYVIEVPDGADALGVEKWRELAIKDNRAARVLRDYIIRDVVKGEQGDAKDL